MGRVMNGKGNVVFSKRQPHEPGPLASFRKCHLLPCVFLLCVPILAIGVLGCASHALSTLEPPPMAGFDMPPALGPRFLIPDSDSDQYGNPVTRHEGDLRCPTTGSPYEIWLKEPRMEFVLVPPGEFRMGSPEKEEGRRPEEGPVHPVQISEPFYMSKYELTCSQWKSLMGSEPWERATQTNDRPRQAASRLSWNDCVGLVKALSGEGVSFSLPTEAQWEYACRAGSASRFHHGEVLPGISTLKNRDLWAGLRHDAGILAALAEAACQSQKRAYFNITDWLSEDASKKGSPRLMDEAFGEQQAAGIVATILQQRLKTFIESVEKNELQEELMLHVLHAAGLRTSWAIRDGIDPAWAALNNEDVRDKNGEIPSVYSRETRDALNKACSRQKRAALELKKARDALRHWLDLQIVLGLCGDVLETQLALNRRVAAISARLTGKTVRELPEADAALVLEFGKEQNSIAQAGQAMEKDICRRLLDCDRQGRRDTWHVLARTFMSLRENRVQDRMARSVLVLKDNRMEIFVRDRQAMVDALHAAVRALSSGGQAAISCDPVPSDASIEEDRRYGEDDESDHPARLGAPLIPFLDWEKSLAAALERVTRLQEEAAIRTRYVQERTDVTPRYRALRTGRMKIYQDNAVKAFDFEKLPEMAKAENFEPLVPFLGEVRSEMTAAGEMLAAGVLNEETADIQDDAFKSIDDLRRFVSVRSGAQDHAGTNTLAALRVLEKVAWAEVLQAQVARRCRRLRKDSSGLSPLQKKMREQAAGAALRRQEEVRALLAEAARTAAESIRSYSDTEKDPARIRRDLRMRVAMKMQNLLPLEDFQRSAEMIRKGKWSADVEALVDDLRRRVARVAREISGMVQDEMPMDAPDAPVRQPIERGGHDAEHRGLPIEERLNLNVDPGAQMAVGGTRNANAWGLYNMHDGVWEWCRDWYGTDSYRTSRAQDPTGPADGTNRVLRGGSRFVIIRNCRSAERHSDSPDVKGANYGFRPVVGRQAPPRRDSAWAAALPLEEHRRKESGACRNE